MRHFGCLVVGFSIFCRKLHYSGLYSGAQVYTMLSFSHAHAHPCHPIGSFALIIMAHRQTAPISASLQLSMNENERHLGPTKRNYLSSAFLNSIASKRAPNNATYQITYQNVLDSLAQPHSNLAERLVSAASDERKLFRWYVADSFFRRSGHRHTHRNAHFECLSELWAFVSAHLWVYSVAGCAPLCPFSHQHFVGRQSYNLMYLALGQVVQRRPKMCVLPSYILAFNSQIAWQIIKKISNDSWAMWYEASRLISAQLFVFCGGVRRSLRMQTACTNKQQHSAARTCVIPGNYA